jgi:CTP-dependent riboflavin kinase
MKQPRYGALIGFTPYPGTINLLALDTGDFKIHDREPIDVVAIAARKYLRVCPCRVDGQEAAIIASWCPGGYYRDSGLVAVPDRTLFEVVAPQRLDMVSVGAKVTLTFDPSDATMKPI